MTGAMSIFMGLGSTFLSNCFYLVTSYVVKHKPVSPGEVMVFSAFLRILVFGVWAAKHFCRSIMTTNTTSSTNGTISENTNTSSSTKIWLCAIISNIMLSIAIILCYNALKMLPLSDFIVFSFTSPVFTMLAVMVMMRSKVTVINILLCVLIVAGAVFVAQPEFIFGVSNSLWFQGYTQTYALGVCLAMGTASLSGIAPVLQSMCRDLPLPYFMFCGGITNLVVALLAPLFGVPNHLHDITRFQDDLGVLTIICSASILAATFVQVALTYSDPILVSSTRSIEIVMALLLDICFPHGQPIDYQSLSFLYKVVGSMLVTTSVIGIAFSDQINSKISDCRKRRNRRGYNLIEDDDSSLTSSTISYGSLDSNSDSSNV